MTRYALALVTICALFGGSAHAAAIGGGSGGNAATATALAANGTNCAAGQYPLGVDASGNAESCTVASGSGTVTNTGGNLTSNAVVLGAGTVDAKVSTGITSNGTAQLVLGVNTTTLGSVKLFGSTSGDATISPSAVAGTATAITLPAVSGTAIVGTGGTTANAIPKTSGTSGQLLQASGVTVDASNNLTVPGTLTLGSGAGPAIFDMLEGAAPGANATANHHNVYLNSTGSVLESHENGGSVKTYVYQGGDVGAATGTTPSANDNDTSLATTAYVQTELTAYASDTVTFTNKTYDAEGTGNVLTIPRRIWLPAAGCNNATAGSVWDLPASSPAVAACITGTNTQKGVLDFADAASLSAQLTYVLPSTWTGTVDAKIKWLTTATSGDVVWQLATICVADAETDDPAFNTASTVTDTAKGTTNQTNDAAITTVTVTGCAASELLHVKILRDSAHASDTLAATARLIGVELVIREAI